MHRTHASNTCIEHMHLTHAFQPMHFGQWISTHGSQSMHLNPCISAHASRPICISAYMHLDLCISAHASRSMHLDACISIHASRAFMPTSGWVILYTHIHGHDLASVGATPYNPSIVHHVSKVGRAYFVHLTRPAMDDCTQ